MRVIVMNTVVLVLPKKGTHASLLTNLPLTAIPPPLT